MLSPPIARALAQQRTNDLLRDAARDRLGQHARRSAPRHLRVALGRLLVTVGLIVAGRAQLDETTGLRPYPM